jgi:hypothetical protein
MRVAFGNNRSLKVPGSISSALAMRYFDEGIIPIGIKLHFIPVLKPARHGLSGYCLHQLLYFFGAMLFSTLRTAA